MLLRLVAPPEQVAGGVPTTDEQSANSIVPAQHGAEASSTKTKASTDTRIFTAPPPTADNRFSTSISPAVQGSLGASRVPRHRNRRNKLADPIFFIHLERQNPTGIKVGTNGNLPLCAEHCTPHCKSLPCGPRGAPHLPSFGRCGLCRRHPDRSRAAT